MCSQSPEASESPGLQFSIDPGAVYPKGIQTDTVLTWTQAVSYVYTDRSTGRVGSDVDNLKTVVEFY